MLKKVALLIGITIILVQGASSYEGEQEIGFGKNLRQFPDTIDMLLSMPLKDPDNGRDFRKLWFNMGEQFYYLSTTSSKKKVPAEYVDALLDNDEALKRVSKSDKKLQLTDEQRLAVCRAVEQDLIVKVSYALKNKDAPHRLVEVSVKTVNKGEEVKGCEVWFAAGAWVDVIDRHKKFPKESSPTAYSLPPGYYRMWTKRGKEEAKKVPVDVGIGGTKELKIDLTAP
jgi:hypothetical protein